MGTHMKKTIRDFEMNHKTVLIRVDFNVPLEQGDIVDDTRIVESLRTIQYAMKNKAKVVLLSHLGRVKNERDKSSNSLKPVAEKLQSLLNKGVTFVPQTRGRELEEAILNLKPGHVLLMENTRFEDINGNKESSNDPELGAYWASLGDIFINDAFGTSHRAHASNVGIASHLPNGIGFLMEKELKMLEPLLNNPEHPFTILLGGAKVSDKIGVIASLAEKADYLLIGGGMAYTFLKASGIETGSSLLDREQLEFCHEMLEKYPEKIVLPIDSVVAEDLKRLHPRTCFINEIKEEEIGLDIGHKTVNLFKQYLEQSKTIFWNGPMGMFEQPEFQAGTKEIGAIICSINGMKIAGGGDTVHAIKEFGYEKSFTHISTGGGATLELLEGKTFPALEVIHD